MTTTEWAVFMAIIVAFAVVIGISIWLVIRCERLTSENKILEKRVKALINERGNVMSDHQ